MCLYSYLDMNICVRSRVHSSSSDYEWSTSVSHVTPAIRDAYVEYKERIQHYRETPHIRNEYIVYRPDNDPYLPTYIARVADIRELNGIGEESSENSIVITSEMHLTMEHENKTTPITDLNDIYVFITDNIYIDGNRRGNWVPARSYQSWAYRDFVYDRYHTIKKSYMSRLTSPLVYQNDENILANQIVTIELSNISPNIVFNMSRYENNSVYFERNDELRTRVRICDNPYARNGYLAFYSRITANYNGLALPQLSPSIMGDTTGTTVLLSVSHIPPPEETHDEDDQCILCVRYRANTRFSPCDHHVCCSDCYSKMAKNVCPVCRAEITQVMNV